MQLDTSAILWSAPERERAGRPLLVLLHGYGSHEGDLFSMSPGLPLGPVIASVRAPVAESGGWAWWSREDSPSGNPPAERVDAAANAVIEWLDGLEYTSVSLLGFSQGASVGLDILGGGGGDVFECVQEDTPAMDRQTVPGKNGEYSFCSVEVEVE